MNTALVGVGNCRRDRRPHYHHHGYLDDSGTGSLHEIEKHVTPARPKISEIFHTFTMS